MGGLIGTATKEKDGLMSKKMATIEIKDWSSNDEYIKIETGNGTSCILAITYTRNGASFWTIFGISGPYLSTSSVLLSIQGIKFYRDNTGDSLYITKSDSWSGRLYITPLINSDLEAGCSISKISGSLDLSNKTEISALL